MRAQRDALPATSQEPYWRTAAAIQQSLKRRADLRRTRFEWLADQITRGFGSMLFLIANAVWFAVWIAANLNLIPGVPVFDPFPFGLLTMVVSLEAIILAIVVLISQNRAARIADLREEVALQVEEISEREITKVLALIALLLQQQGIDISQDDELRAMLQATDTERLTEQLEQEV